jgi:hypothetical protein
MVSCSLSNISSSLFCVKHNEQAAGEHGVKPGQKSATMHSLVLLGLPFTISRFSYFPLKVTLWDRHRTVIPTSQWYPGYLQVCPLFEIVLILEKYYHSHSHLLEALCECFRYNNNPLYHSKAFLKSTATVQKLPPK